MKTIGNRRRAVMPYFPSKSLQARPDFPSKSLQAWPKILILKFAPAQAPVGIAQAAIWKRHEDQIKAMGSHMELASQVAWANLSKICLPGQLSPS